MSIRVITKAGKPNTFKTTEFKYIDHAVNFAREFRGRLLVGERELTQSWH